MSGPEKRFLPLTAFQSTTDFLSNTTLSDYTLVLVIAPVSSQILLQLSNKAWEARIPLVYIHSVGFYAHFSIQLTASFPIVDTHPDPTSTQDLRLLAPWEELLEHATAQTKDLERLSDHDHGHIPYLLLLLHYLDVWQNQHDGNYPQTYNEKDALRSMVREAARRDNPERGEENYDEAVGAVLKSLNPPSIPSGLKEIFAEAECQNPQPTVSYYNPGSGLAKSCSPQTFGSSPTQYPHSS